MGDVKMVSGILTDAVERFKRPMRSDISAYRTGSLPLVKSFDKGVVFSAVWVHCKPLCRRKPVCGTLPRRRMQRIQEAWDAVIAYPQASDDNVCKGGPLEAVMVALQ